MINLVVFTPNGCDATSWYRCMGPLYALRRSMHDLNVITGSQADWTTMKLADLIFIQRPALPSHAQLVDLAKVNRKRVWVDYDDDLYCVPMNNPTHALYNNPKTQNIVTQIVAKADFVTVSTVAIAEKLKAILEGLARGPAERGWNLNTHKILVLPNAYDLEMLSDLKKFSRQPPNNLVVWRGSATHDKDLALHTAPLCKAIANHLDWTLNMVGSPFWWTVEQIDEIPGIKPTNNIVTETMDPINYFEFLAAIRPALMIVPLEDFPFNHAKSNIVWLEGLHAGAVTLAPDWPEWRRPGIINYKNPEDFGDKLDNFMSGGFDTASLWRQSRDYVFENLLLSTVNRRRESIIRDFSRR